MTDDQKHMLLKLLTKEQWGLIAVCFDSVSFKSMQLEDAVKVKEFLMEVLKK